MFDCARPIGDARAKVENARGTEKAMTGPALLLAQVPNGATVLPRSADPLGVPRPTIEALLAPRPPRGGASAGEVPSAAAART
jgi:hypothetical protein